MLPGDDKESFYFDTIQDPVYRLPVNQIVSVAVDTYNNIGTRSAAMLGSAPLFQVPDPDFQGLSEEVAHMLVPGDWYASMEELQPGGIDPRTWEAPEEWAGEPDKFVEAVVVYWYQTKAPIINVGGAIGLVQGSQRNRWRTDGRYIWDDEGNPQSYWTDLDGRLVALPKDYRPAQQWVMSPGK